MCYCASWDFIWKVRAGKRRRGAEELISIEQVNLARRLKMAEPFDVIGGDKVPEAAVQPPDQIYWNALRTWGILRPNAWGCPRKRAQLHFDGLDLRSPRKSELDDAPDGASLQDDDTPFAGIRDPPDEWFREDKPLHFRLPGQRAQTLEKQNFPLFRGRA